MSNMDELFNYNLDQLRLEEKNEQDNLNEYYNNIELCQNRIRTCKRMGARDFSDEIKELEEEVYNDTNNITSTTHKISMLKTVIINKIESLILADEEPELTEEEANYLIEKYTPLVDEAAKEKNDDQDNYNSMQYEDLTDEDKLLEFNTYASDLKDSEEKFNKYSKILYYAENRISQKTI